MEPENKALVVLGGIIVAGVFMGLGYYLGRVDAIREIYREQRQRQQIVERIPEPTTRPMMIHEMVPGYNKDLDKRRETNGGN